MLDELCGGGNVVRHQHVPGEVSRGEQILKNANDGNLRGPILHSKQYHRAEIIKRPIVILSPVLEDFLDCPGFAWKVDDALLRDRQEAVFPEAVLKVLCNMGGKRGGRLMTIVPGWERQTLTWRRDRGRNLVRRFEPCVCLSHQLRVNLPPGIDDVSESRHHRLSLQ